MRSAKPAAGKFLAVAAVGLWSPALAQVRQGLEIGAYGSLMQAKGGVTRVNNARFSRVETHVDDGAGAGFRAAYNFNQRFALEGVFAGSTNNHFAQLTVRGSPAATTDTNALFFVHANPVLHLLRGRVVPYVSPGVGILGTVDTTNPAFNYGGGVKLFATQRLAVRLDARRYHATVKGTLDQIVPSQQGLVEIPEPFEDKLRFNELSVGFTFFFRRE